MQDLGIHAEELPRVLALNKADLVGPEELASLRARLGGIPISAAAGEGLDKLRALLTQTLEDVQDRRERETAARRQAREALLAQPAD